MWSTGPQGKKPGLLSIGAHRFSEAKRQWSGVSRPNPRFHVSIQARGAEPRPTDGGSTGGAGIQKRIRHRGFISQRKDGADHGRKQRTLVVKPLNCSARKVRRQLSLPGVRHNLTSLPTRSHSKGTSTSRNCRRRTNSKGASVRVRDEVVARFRHLDILINNLGQARPFGMNNTDSEWDEAFNLNFTTSRKLSEAFLDGMVAQKFGRIICLSATSEPFGMQRLSHLQGCPADLGEGPVAHGGEGRRNGELRLSGNSNDQSDQERIHSARSTHCE